ncbi:MAG: anthranilate phosphoribosyltransferase [Nitriliruptoraceae bacterium]
MSEFEWSDVLTRLLAGDDLSEDESAAVMSAVMSGEAAEGQIGALLVALQAKGESGDEVAGFVRAMLAAAEPIVIDAGVADRLVDVVGTGGDRAGTFNISTIASVVVAAAGSPVAKHGNRAASSRCGSADLIEAWGVVIDAPIDVVAHTIEEVGIGFLFARTFHPSMRVVGPVRQQIGIPTTFNILGPLSNPAGAPHQAVGVASERLAPVMAEALRRLGRRRALVFRGRDGLDELTTTDVNDVWEVRDGKVSVSTIDARDLGIARATREDLLGGDVDDNLTIADEVLRGVTGPRADVVALNAAAGLYVAGAVDDLGAGVELARRVLADGAGRDLRDRWVARTRELVRS